MILLVLIIITIILFIALNLSIKQRGKNAKAVLFYAPWCGYCNMIKPSWERLEEEYPDFVTKVDCDAHPEIGNKFSIKGFPTILYCPDGLSSEKGVTEYNGNREYDDLKSFVTQSMDRGVITNLASQILPKKKQDVPKTISRFDGVRYERPLKTSQTLI